MTDTNYLYWLVYQVCFFKDIEMDMTVEQNVGYQAITYAQHKSIRLNDADYCYLEAGEGPMLLLLHGYPDNAYSWEQQIRFWWALRNG